MRELRYASLAADVRRRIAADEYGGLLPSESELGSEYGVSRVTVRKALAELKREGIVDSRQGFGWYVVAPPLRQSLRDLTTLERQIHAAGREPSREILRFALVATPPRLTELLGAGPVLEVERVDRVDGQPFATATVWVRADVAAGVTRRSLEDRPLSDQLAVALGGATQAITAVAASKHEADLLGVPKGAPVLRCDRTTRDTAGQPVLRSEALYNPLATEFVADLPPALGDGLRLRAHGAG
jgi:GntR family transcriptional regulator